MHTNLESYIKEQLHYFCLNLRHHRTLAGMTREQLAKQANISASNLIRLESEKNAALPSIHVLCTLAACLGAPLTDLLTYPDEAC